MPQFRDRRRHVGTVPADQPRLELDLRLAPDQSQVKRPLHERLVIPGRLIGTRRPNPVEAIQEREPSERHRHHRLRVGEQRLRLRPQLGLRRVMERLVGLHPGQGEGAGIPRLRGHLERLRQRDPADRQRPVRCRHDWPALIFTSSSWIARAARFRSVGDSMSKVPAVVGI